MPGTMPEPKEICAKQLYHVIDEIERVLNEEWAKEVQKYDND